MNQDENTRLDVGNDANQPSVPLKKVVIPPKKKNAGGGKRALLIVLLVVILGGAATCAYLFVPWKKIFGKEYVRTADDDEEEETEFVAINPETGLRIDSLSFTQYQLDRMPHRVWDPYRVTMRVANSLVIIPEKKLLLGYDTYVDKYVIYDGGLDENGSIVAEEIEQELIIPEEEEIYIEPEEELLTEIKTVDEPVGREPETAVVAEAPAQESKKEEEVFRAVEQMPSYPGGDAALYKAINDNLRYPPVAAENNIQGQVVVQFVVHKDGSIGKVVVARGVDPDLDKEAVRVTKKLGKFSPGRNNGQPVAVWYTLPIRFKLANM